MRNKFNYLGPDACYLGISNYKYYNNYREMNKLRTKENKQEFQINLNAKDAQIILTYPNVH